jgi:hypothetical protein
VRRDPIAEASTSPAHRPKAVSFARAWASRGSVDAPGDDASERGAGGADQEQGGNGQGQKHGAGGSWDTSSGAMTAGGLLVFAAAAPVDWLTLPLIPDAAESPRRLFSVTMPRRSAAMLSDNRNGREEDLTA